MKKIIIILIFVAIRIIGINVIYGEEKFSIHGGRKIEDVAREFEGACLNHGEIRASFLARELVKYGEQAIPIFEKVINLNTYEAQFFSIYGLGKIKSEKAVDVLINKYKVTQVGKEINKDIILAIGETGTDNAIKILKNLTINGRDNNEKFWAILARAKSGDKDAEQMLIKAAKDKENQKMDNFQKEGMITDICRYFFEKSDKRILQEIALDMLNSEKLNDKMVSTIITMLKRTYPDDLFNILLQMYDKHPEVQTDIIEDLRRLIREHKEKAVLTLENILKKEKNSYRIERIKNILKENK